jgi:HEAT repeat protein
MVFDAVQTLGWYRADQCAPEFNRLLDNPETALTGAALLSVCGSNGIPGLFIALTNRDSTVRAAAAYDLGFGIQTDAIVPRLLQSLKDSNSEVREQSAYALSKFTIDTERITPALIDALHDPDNSVRCAAAYALGKFGRNASNAVPALVRFFQDEPNNRVTTAMALTNISPEAARSIGER